jgi:antitoxin VapB
MIYPIRIILSSFVGHIHGALEQSRWHSEAAMAKARLFWSGRSQAVRLPKEFRFGGEEVRIRRRGSAVILEPVGDDWSWLDAIFGTLDEDFVQAVNEQPEQQRPALDEAFR